MPENIFKKDQIVSYVSVICNAFNHFCALFDKDYNFSWVICGPHSLIVIANRNWRNTCHIPGTQYLQLHITTFNVLI